MKKILCIALAVMLVLSMCTVSLAANISSFKLTKVQRIGLKGDTMRFVVSTSVLPSGATAENMVGATVDGTMKYKADEEGKGDLTMRGNKIVGFDPGASTTVIVIASNEAVDYTMIDDGAGKYDFDLTVTPQNAGGSGIRSFQVTFIRGGASKYVRLVVSTSEFPADINFDLYAGATITGTLTHISDASKSIVLDNEIVSVEKGDKTSTINVKDGGGLTKESFQIGSAYSGKLTITVTMPALPEGIMVTDVESSGQNLSLYVQNGTDSALSNAVLIAAVYDEAGVLVDAQTLTLDTISPQTKSEKISLIFRPTSPWKTGKIILLKSRETLTPIAQFTAFTYQDPDFSVPDAGGENYGSVAEDDWKLAENYEKEANVRSGIPNVLSKLKNGEKVNIAFLGGSVTQQYKWSESVLRYLKKTYPNAEITDYNIGLSGTGTWVGAIRLDKDVLSLNPDLIFIEYGGNGGTDEQMEGIFRKIWTNNPNTDVIMVNTMHADWYKTYQSGGLPDNISRFERIAEHYGVPSASFGYQVAAYYEKGWLTLSGTKEENKILYASDGIHPTADGGQLAGGAVVRSMIRMESAGVGEKAHVLPEPIYEHNWEKASSIRFEDFSKAKFEGSWFDCLNDGTGGKYGTNYEYTGGYVSMFKNLFANGMKGTKTAGDKVTVRFRGTTVGIFEAGGQYSGQLKMYIDGVLQPSPLVLYCSYDTKPRHQLYYIPSLEYGEHEVTFELDSTMPDKSANANKNPNDKIYERNELYIGSIVSDGEILDMNQ